MADFSTSPAVASLLDRHSTVYATVSNQGVIYYLGPGLDGHVEPAFDAMPNGIGNGSIVALDLAAGNIKWEHKTDFPTWVSPLVTNGMVITGHITGTGKPYEFNAYTQLQPSLRCCHREYSWPLMPRLARLYGSSIWEFNMGAPITLGGPSIGNSMLLVGVGAPNEVGSNNGGYIVGFGLPSTSKPGIKLSMAATQFSDAAISGWKIRPWQARCKEVSLVHTGYRRIDSLGKKRTARACIDLLNRAP